MGWHDMMYGSPHGDDDETSEERESLVIYLVFNDRTVIKAFRTEEQAKNYVVKNPGAFGVGTWYKAVEVEND